MTTNGALVEYREIFDKKAFAYVATVGAGEAPQSTPVWVDFDGKQGAESHIDALAKKCIGQDRHPWRRPGEVRVTVAIVSEHCKEWDRC